jgi:transcriptional regulator with XRE-family HTH domain
MTPDQFKAWRKAMGLKQKEAADLLGLKKRVIQYYERGTRDGKDIEVPRTVALACYALTVGVETFDGTIAVEPAAETAAKKPPSRARKPRANASG